MKSLKKAIMSSIRLKQNILKDDELLTNISFIIGECISALERGNKIYWCGNGGSAADAQHLAAELSGRFYYDRPPLASEALHCNTSYLTAVANDYSYDEIYSRLIKGIGKYGDVLFCMTTSGKSENIKKAIDVANDLGMIVIVLTGANPDIEMMCCRHLIRVPSTDTPRIQEAHMLIGHTICQMIEEKIYPQE